MQRGNSRSSACMIAITTLLAITPVLAIDDALKAQQASDSSAAASQTRIDGLAEKTTGSLQAYRVALQRAESLEIYNKQLARLIESQNSEIQSIARQTGDIENIETGALPLMIEMTDTLDKLLDADVPFLLTERQTRINNLRALIDRADVTSGEKFRRVMEAYLIEVEYGRTIEAYKGELKSGDEVLTVDFLRVGRVGLYYQTLDGSVSGRWNATRKDWEQVDSDYRSRIQLGIRIARKQMPPEMLTLPVDAAGDPA